MTEKEPDLNTWMQKTDVKYPFCAAELLAPNAQGELFTLLLDDAALKECSGSVDAFEERLAAVREPLKT